MKSVEEVITTAMELARTVLSSSLRKDRRRVGGIHCRDSESDDPQNLVEIQETNKNKFIIICGVTEDRLPLLSHPRCRDVKCLSDRNCHTFHSISKTILLMEIYVPIDSTVF